MENKGRQIYLKKEIMKGPERFIFLTLEYF